MRRSRAYRDATLVTDTLESGCGVRRGTRSCPTKQTSGLCLSQYISSLYYCYRFPLHSVMGPHQGQSSGNARVEAIDLTLSSPEPESRSQHRSYSHTQQQQRVGTMREEPRSSHRGMHSSKDDAQREGVARSGIPLQQLQRRINPQHVKQMIDTSNHRALRSVVLQLCQTSPALCGALVRGLEPHSPWAQALISRQRAKSQTQTKDAIKNETRTNEQDAYERMKNRLGNSGDSQSAVSQPRANRPPAVQADPNHLRLPSSSQKPSTVKREHQASPTNSDDSTNIVDFSTIERDAQKEEPTRRATAHSTDALRNSGHLVARDSSAHGSVRDDKQKPCSQCGELYEDSNGRCYFHPGREGQARLGDIPQFTCCNRFTGEPGCKVGRHTSEKSGTLTITKRASPSRQSGAQWPKKPRFM